MNRNELRDLFGETLRSPDAAAEQYEALADAVLKAYEADPEIRVHIANRSKRVTEATGQAFDPNNFDLGTARAFIADETGFSSWESLINTVEGRSSDPYPMLFRYAVAALWRGDFTALEYAVGGAEAFSNTIVDWYEKGYFANETETFNEAFAASCMLGHDQAAAYLLDKGVDPYAGIRTGLAGFHYAASSGRLNVIKLLVARKVPMEVENMYGGTVFGQAMWSAVNEYKPDHAAIIEALVEAGAVVDEGYREWWDKQDVPDAATKERVAELLNRHREFHQKVLSAEERVLTAEKNGNKRAVADALKQLGNILRRPPFARDAANRAYARAADIYHELGMPLEEAWVKRHIGINHEYAERLTEAEKFYDEALDLYRENAKSDDLNFANAVRYPAVIKNRLGKRDESSILWEEAYDRYSKIHPDGLGEGAAEAAAWLTIFAIEKNDLLLAKKWFAKASEASARSDDPDTHKFIAEVISRLEES